ncbi:MAG: T9SS C-terminal target domain-containing protein [Calditrichaeota bacterium]|nr:MAG: T9SS C-terminal target domain-containing protein [Calditrichota bacterium]
MASAGQAAVTLVAFDSSGAQVPGANVTSVATGDEPLPERFALHPNYPNPFNPETTIRYDLPVPAEVRLTIYDLLGRVVRTLVAKKQAAGAHAAVWDGRDDSGKQLASGVYVYRLDAGEFKKSAKMLLLK